MRYIWDKDQHMLVEIGRQPSPTPQLHLQTDRGFENLQATDGTDLTSRTKWENYMREHNLTISNDFKEEWEQAAKHREELRTEGGDHKRRREAILEALNTPVSRQKEIAREVKQRTRSMGSGKGWY